MSLSWRAWPRSSHPACCRCCRWCWPHRRTAAGAGRSGIAIGLAVAFVIFTLTASRLLMALGLPQDLLRNLAIAMLARGRHRPAGAGGGDAGGTPLPPAGGLGRRRVSTTARGSGRASGWAPSLSLVWTPCAGPILAAVTVLSAESRVSLELVAIIAAYALGATVPLFVLALLGNRAVAPLAGVRRGGPMLRRAAGVVLLATAVLFTTDIPTQLAAGAPSYVTSLQHLERSHAAASDLRDLTRSSRQRGRRGGRRRHAGHASELRAGAGLRRHHRLDQHARSAAAYAGGAARQGRAGRLLDLLLRELHPHAALPEGVVRALPPRRPRDRRRAHARVRIRACRSATSEQAVGEHGIRYPVAVDDNYGTWNAWGNQYWPADYLIDRNGDVRDAHFGEGGYSQTEDDIRTLWASPRTAALCARPAPSPPRPRSARRRRTWVRTARPPTASSSGRDGSGLLGPGPGRPEPGRAGRALGCGATPDRGRTRRAAAVPLHRAADLPGGRARRADRPAPRPRGRPAPADVAVPETTSTGSPICRGRGRICCGWWCRRERRSTPSRSADRGAVFRRSPRRPAGGRRDDRPPRHRPPAGGRDRGRGGTRSPPRPAAA